MPVGSAFNIIQNDALSSGAHSIGSTKFHFQGDSSTLTVLGVVHVRGLLVHGQSKYYACGGFSGCSKKDMRIGCSR